MTDAPLFRSAGAALAWAYSGPGDTTRTSSVNRMAGRPRLPVDSDEEDAPAAIDAGLDRKPFGLDGAGQAGLIKSCVLGLTEWERCHIQAMYGRSNERQVAQAALTAFVLPTLDTGAWHRRMVYQLVARFYGKRVPMNRLVEQYEVDHKKLSRARRAVEVALSRIAARADVMITERMRQRGVIG